MARGTKAGRTRQRAFWSKRVSSPKKTVSGKPPRRSQNSLVKAMERAVQDLLGVSAASFTPKKGAEARSQSVGSAGSRQEPPKEYGVAEPVSGAVSRASQSGA